ncbi:hypothetical protein FQN52_001171 [Onygenales sp. PD_12]|nr:hypothetical protein FQN52_001171 [Onygenales sp. PD_12]
MATKTSNLLFYLKLMARDKIFRWATYAALTVVNVAGLAFTFLNAFRCRPFKAAFQHPVTDDAHLGAFVVVVGVVRIAYLQNASLARLQVSTDSQDGRQSDLERDDFLWVAALSFMWSAIEVNVAIICACIHSLKPLVAHVVPMLIRDPEYMNEAGITFNHPHAPESSPPRVNGFTEKNFSPAMETTQINEVREGPQGLVEFSSTPALLASGSYANDPDGGSTNSRRRRRTAPFFDFVDEGPAKTMLKMTKRESIPVLAMITVLFFLWGFAYRLLDILNSQFQLIVEMSSARVNGLHAAYFGGYILGPIAGRLVFKLWGYRSTFVVGLCIYACGVLMFWPSAVLGSFIAFLMSNLIVGSGLAVFETAANSFVALCGPMEYSEARLNIAQGFQAIGAATSPLLAKRVLFCTATDVPLLIDTQWTYLGIAFFAILLAIVFYCLPIPEASDQELADLTDQRLDANSARIGQVRVVWATLTLGLVAQFFYFGGQEAMNTHFQSRIASIKTDTSLTPFDHQAIGHALFALSRFITAAAHWLTKPRLILLALYVAMIACTVLSMFLHDTPALVLTLLIYLFSSGVFSLTFAISLRGMCPHTKTASALLTSAISGGSIFPSIQPLVAKRHGIHFSFIVPLSLFAIGSIFPLYLNLVPAARRQVDPIANEYLHPHPQRDRLRRWRQGALYFDDERDDDSDSPFPSVARIARCRRAVLVGLDGPFAMHAGMGPHA